MGSLGFWEIFTLAVLALFIFGPERLPGMARQAAKTLTAIRREANKTLGELKESVDLDDDLAGVARDARELSTSLRDIRGSAASALMGPMNEVKGELQGASDDLRGATTGLDKPQSGPGMAALSPTAAGAIPGAAPFDPDAT